MDYTIQENQTQLKDKLHGEQIVLVSFTKKDGSRRDMYCTLNGRHIPPAQVDSAGVPLITGQRPNYETSLAVYDVRANGWRSFRWDSIIEVH